jgi:hypothetical protein
MKRIFAGKIYLFFLILTVSASLMAGCGKGSSGHWQPPNNLDEAPAVTFTSPENGDTGVPTNAKISATFSKEMNPATISSATFLLRRGATVVAGTVTYTGITAVFAAALLPNTDYTATITTGATDLGGKVLESDFVWTFSTGPGADNTRPTVTFTTPEMGDTAVPVNTIISAAFSEAMEPSTINNSTFTLRHGATADSGTVTYSGVTAVFAVVLLPNTDYTATITTGAEDLADNALESDYVWTFRTGSAADVTAPTVSSTVPVSNATGVPIGNNITATFSEAMNPLTLTTSTFTLAKQSAPTVLITGGIVTYVGLTASLNPAANLAANTDYIATIKGGATGAKDLAGNALASNYVWSFRTGATPDTTAPTVISETPAPGATGVTLNTSVTATFSEAMDPLRITTTTFTLYKQGAPNVFATGTVTYTGVTATFKPSFNLAANSDYTATIKGGVGGARDLAGNEMAADHVWSFRTGAAADATRPTVLSETPINNSLDVPTNTASVTATFSEAMKSSTITTTTFTLLKEGTPDVFATGTVTYLGTTATFTPNNRLAAKADYTATIKGGALGAKDLADNALLVDYVWTFRTGAPPTVVSVFPTTASTGVCVNMTIGGIFNEAMTSGTILAPGAITVRTSGPPLGASLGGVASYNAGTKTATFNPTSDFLPNTSYTATIKGGTTGVADLSGDTMSVDKVWTFRTGSTICQESVVLGDAGPFAILASAAVTNIPTSHITGNVGLTPDTGANITGFSSPLTCPEVTGTIYKVDAAGPACAMIDPVLLTNAKTAAQTAFTYARAAVRGTPAAISGNINGLTLYPGLYESGTSIEISAGGHLYLDGQGDPNAVFIIRSATTITTSSTSQVHLTNGTKATNVFWTAGSAVTLGANSIMKGTMIAGTALTLQTGANLEGRALNQGAAAAAVSCDSCTITVPTP